MKSQGENETAREEAETKKMTPQKAKKNQNRNDRSRCSRQNKNCSSEQASEKHSLALGFLHYKALCCLTRREVVGALPVVCAITLNLTTIFRQNYDTIC
jgi:hypothetical protein